MPDYEVEITFSFTGKFRISADSAQEAHEKTKAHCGMTAGSITSTLENVTWDFPAHPEKEVKEIACLSGPRCPDCLGFINSNGGCGDCGIDTGISGQCRECHEYFLEFELIDGVCENCWVERVKK